MPQSPRVDPLAVGALVAAMAGFVADCCCAYVGPPLSLLAIVLAIGALVMSKGRPDNGANTVISVAALAAGALNVLLAVGLLVWAIGLGGLDFPVFPDGNPPPFDPPELEPPPAPTDGPQLPSNNPSTPDVLPEPPGGADTARIELVHGDAVSVESVTERLGIEEGFEVIAVIHRHERWLPMPQAGLIVLRRTRFPDDFETWAAEAEARDSVRWEGGDPNEIGIVEDVSPERCLGAHELVRHLPEASGVGPLVLDVETGALHPYRIRPVRLAEIEEGLRHGTRLGGAPEFIQAYLFANRRSDDRIVPFAAQLGGDLFDVTFGDAGTLYVFGDHDGTLSACAQD